jgi:hypothetical protein
LEGLVCKFAYKLERHRLLRMTLRRWLILVCLGAPLSMWLGIWEVSWPAAALTTLVALAALTILWWAERRRYVRFEEDARATGHAPAGSLLPPMSKVPVGATGFFEVGGMRRYLVETPAEYTTFETREHCLMTRVPFSRFLLLGQSSRDEVGWWYTFFQHHSIKTMTRGVLHFGLHPRLAVRLALDAADQPEDAILYLSFDDEATRALVLADLHLDGGADSA